jgi:hypothetical protein
VAPETLPRGVAAETKPRRELEALRQEAMDEEKDQDNDITAAVPNVRIMVPCWRSTRAVRRTATRILLRTFREMAILNRDKFSRLISLLAFFSGMVSSGDQVLLVSGILLGRATQLYDTRCERQIPLLWAAWDYSLKESH